MHHLWAIASTSKCYYGTTDVTGPGSGLQLTVTLKNFVTLVLFGCSPYCRLRVLLQVLGMLFGFLGCE